jgi:hypothetical protein
MMLGIITTKHILFHPVTLIAQLGLFGYLRLLTRCMDGSPHCFTDFLHF